MKCNDAYGLNVSRPCLCTFIICHHGAIGTHRVHVSFNVFIVSLSKFICMSREFTPGMGHTPPGMRHTEHSLLIFRSCPIIMWCGQLLKIKLI